ncbi:glycosyltransferase family 87 protein [Pseudorhodoplanes sp.]|uniref:glycosyltransferase family 87 protein n=1 Tax=Pseudorhodoplanes sp. TaxID=1934341 RepID=UPI003D0D56AD
MPPSTIAAIQAPAASLAKPVELTLFGLCVANALYLVFALLHGTILVGADGLPIPTDFVNVWAGGRVALEGQAAAAYDAVAHKAAQVAALGRDFAGEYPWVYPPTFFFAAAPLAMLPLTAAHVAWVAMTFAAFAAVMVAIMRGPVGLVMACAFPGIVANASVGQNGFLTAALIGGMLIVLNSRPLLAGILLGLLSFKPHFGVLIPLVLIAGGYWRVLFAAAATTLLLALAAWLVFGFEVWEGFFDALRSASQAALSLGLADWSKLQSLFGLVRILGGGETLAFVLQWMLAGATGLLLCLLWRSRAPFNLKAAGLAVGILLVPPYLFMYDDVTLAVAMAFLFREMQARGALPGEQAGLGAALLLVLIFPIVKVPVGFDATLVVALLIARRTDMDSGFAPFGRAPE